MDNYMHHHAHMDFSDFPPHAGLHEEYDEGPEVLSRPRLTKDQVEVLESQFQAHPKPNGNIKRQLAIQTKLTLPRVANWFQNRRAKAKQQKKQEEFEQMQAMAQTGEKGEDSSKSTSHPYPESTATDDSETVIAASNEGEEKHSQVRPPPQPTSMASATASPIARSTSTQAASWASLQRALASAEAARTTQYPLDDSFGHAQTLESPPQMSDMTSSNDSQFPSSTFSEWTQASSVDWTSSSHSDQAFDFTGLNIHNTLSSPEQFIHSEPHIMFRNSPEAVSESASDEWVSNVQTPTLLAPQSTSLVETSYAMPSYPQSRRDSTPDDVTAGVGNIGLTTPTSFAPAANGFSKPDNAIDIAARRKKPRPATLGTAALRSRSYGAPTLSPTVRYTSSPVHSIRHVKSTGNNLNVHYGGIRKTSSAQRSPLNISTFAEAQALNAMMAANSSVECSTSSMGAPQASLSPEEHCSIPVPSTIDEHCGLSHEYYQLDGHSHVNITSPPATPLKAEYFAQQQFGAMAPPVSAPPQYAVFPDYTPPYSAGPLTTGSWSDAPLTSPDHSSFGPPLNMSQSSYISPMMHEYGSATSFSLPFTSPSDLKSDPSKSTEFYIQEFPQQRENHAQAAQHMSHQKPKNYVFANATANDFSE